MNERPYSKAGYCDVCTRWYEIPASGNCDCGGKILLTPGTQFSRELVQISRIDLEQLVGTLERIALDGSSYSELAANFRAEYLSMSERYCPECKQNVEVADADDYIFTPCFNCGYAFGVVVDKAELESFVNLTEVLIGSVKTLAALVNDARPMPESIPTVTAKFRKKYLEAK